MPVAITIATNMAARGTDIMLGGNPEAIIGDETDPQKIAEINQKIEADKKIAIEAGGLFVLGTERHESRRIDNQLRGRSGRQGDPGKSKFFLSLEDDLMRIFGSEKLQSLLSTFGLKDDEAIFHPWITKTLAGAQRKVENRNYEIRKNLLKYDDIVNHQRKNIFSLRSEIINSQDVSKKIYDYGKQIIKDLVEDCIPKNTYSEQWETDLLAKEIYRIYGLKLDLVEYAKQDGVGQGEVLDYLEQAISELFASKEKICDLAILKQIQKQIFLITIDSEWKDHLLSLDKLRYGINLRAYAQKDPLIEYKRDAFNLFEEMILRIEEQVVARFAHMQINVEADNEEKKDLAKQIAIPKKNLSKNLIQTRVDPAFVQSEAKPVKELSNFISQKKKVDPKLRNPLDQSTWGDVGRNEPCPCGSGKKYKNCHGS
jgi:preprotein translocase subunit SecA